MIELTGTDARFREGLEKARAAVNRFVDVCVGLAELIVKSQLGCDITQEVHQWIHDLWREEVFVRRIKNRPVYTWPPLDRWVLHKRRNCDTR